MPEKSPKNDAQIESTEPKKRGRRRRVKEVIEPEKMEYQPPEALKGAYSELLAAQATALHTNEAITTLVGNARIALDEADDITPLEAALFTRQIYTKAESLASRNQDTPSQKRWGKAREKAEKAVEALTPQPPDKLATPSPVPPKSKMTGTTGM